MANPYGGFVHRSPLSSHPHDPYLDFASNCIRDYFGPTVQTVADALLLLGESTLPQIVSAVRSQCRRTLNEDRETLVDRLSAKGGAGGKRVDINRARGPEGSGYVADAAPVRAALIVLLQHSIVTATPVGEKEGGGGRKQRGDGGGGGGGGGGSAGGAQYRYAFLPDRARLLVRYPRYVAHTKKAMGGGAEAQASGGAPTISLADAAAAIVEEVCARGRLRAEDCVRFGAESLKAEAAAKEEEDDDDDDGNENGKDKNGGEDGGAGRAKVKSEDGALNGAPATTATEEEEEEKKSAKNKFDEGVALAVSASALLRLVEGGYLERVRPLEEPLSYDPETGEYEFDDGNKRAGAGSAAEKKRMMSSLIEQRKKKRRRRGEDGSLIAVEENGEVEGNNGDDGNDDNGNKKVSFASSSSSSAANSLEELAMSDRLSSLSDRSGLNPDPMPVLIAIRRIDRNRRRLALGSVYRVNAKMYHDSLRAAALGRLVAERYVDRVPCCGSYVAAALDLAAHREHSPTVLGWDVDGGSDGGGGGAGGLTEDQRARLAEDRTCFVPDEIMDRLPPTVSAALRNRAGGARANLSNALVQLTKFGWPQCVAEVEEARGHPRGGKFEISTRQLVEHLKGRALHRAVLDMHGEVAARICSILETKGHLESDAVAQAAMVPAKDVREILHRLYRHNIVSLLNLQLNKQHNQNTAIFLWTVRRPRMYQAICDSVCKALVNLRLRRQHEMEIGKDWIERAKEADAWEENDHALDKLNYSRFCQGLERLDNACLQLDETLMLLKDF